MIKEILWGAIILSFVTAGILVFLLAASEVTPSALLRNETSLYSKLNIRRLTVYKREKEQLNEVGKYSSKNAVKLAMKLSDEFKISLDTCLALYDQAIAWRSDSDSVVAKLNRATELINRCFIQFEGYYSEPYSKEDVDYSRKELQRFGEAAAEWLGAIDRLSKELVVLNLERTRLSTLGLFGFWQQQLGFEADAMTVKVDNWSGAYQPPRWMEGIIAFNAPETMLIGEKDRIQVRISKLFATDLATGLRGSGEVTVDTLKVSEIMMVKLNGDQFEIAAFDDEEQGVTDDGYTQWEFEISPKTYGDHDLYLKVGIVYFVPNLGPTKKYFPVYEKRIHVKVTVWQQVAGFATERWEFILSTIVIPATVWTVARWRRRRVEKG